MDELRVSAERDFPPRRLEQRARHLVREVTARRRRRRVALTLAPAVAILLLGATGFTTYVLTKTSEPTHLESIGCYERANLAADVAVIGSGANPVALCRDAWRGGAFPGAVPRRMAACVLQTGSIAVLPGPRGMICHSLGLAPLGNAGLRAAKRFAALRAALYARIGHPASGSSLRSPACVGEGDARAIVRRELDRRGYSSWRILVVGGGFSAQRPCTELSFDRQAVLLLGVPRS